MPSRKRREQASRRRNTARRQQVAKQSERTAPQHKRGQDDNPKDAE